MGEPRHDGMGASLGRVRLIGGDTLGEALRMRLAVLLALTGVALVLAALWLREFNFGTAELKFVGDFGLGAIGFLGTLLASLASAQLFFSDLTSGWGGCALPRPIPRWAYIW